MRPLPNVEHGTDLLDVSTDRVSLSQLILTQLKSSAELVESVEREESSCQRRSLNPDPYLLMLVYGNDRFKVGGSYAFCLQSLFQRGLA